MTSIVFVVKTNTHIYTQHADKNTLNTSKVSKQNTIIGFSVKPGKACVNLGRITVILPRCKRAILKYLHEKIMRN